MIGNLKHGRGELECDEGKFEGEFDHDKRKSGKLTTQEGLVITIDKIIND